MRGLNQARKLLSKATALLDNKRLLMAIASGKISRVDRLISIGLHQRKGIRGLVALYMAAAEGIYNPKSFTEEEDMKNLLSGGYLEFELQKSTIEPTVHQVFHTLGDVQPSHHSSLLMVNQLLSKFSTMSKQRWRVCWMSFTVMQRQRWYTQ